MTVRGRSSPRWAFMEQFDIMDRNEPTQVYLHRLRVVQTPLFGIYLHRIFLPDADRHPHDHPWPFLSLVLRGGYVEELSELRMTPAQRPKLRTMRRVGMRTHRRWSIHRMPLRRAHRVALIEPGTMTLVLVGRRSKDWGFWTSPTQWVRWDQYDTVDGPEPSVP